MWFLENFYGLVLRLQSQTLIFVVTKVPTPKSFRKKLSKNQKCYKKKDNPLNDGYPFFI
jgi:hypothetical protein